MMSVFGYQSDTVIGNTSSTVSVDTGENQLLLITEEKFHSSLEAAPNRNGYYVTKNGIVLSGDIRVIGEPRIGILSISQPLVSLPVP